MRRMDKKGWRGDRGTLSLFVVIFTPTVLLLAGLLVDGGIAINARQRAADVAEQAARAGANDLDVAALRQGTVQLAGNACAVATAFVPKYAGIGATPGPRPCSVNLVNGQQVIRVYATVTVHSQLLSIIGINTFTESAYGEASPVCGITQGGQC
ncbi:MAG TPA: pilus assembly protein TadG-related protein [Streptosporangiaceae bacterium]